MIVPVEPQEAPAIAAFIERTIALSVDATELEKEAFVRNVRSNLEGWQADPRGALHLKSVAGDGSLAGVVMVKAYWNLCHLFVEPASQGQGVGKALLEAAIAACRGRSPRQCLRLNASRNAAGFYQHMGFTLAADAPPAFAGVQYELPLIAALIRGGATPRLAPMSEAPLVTLREITADTVIAVTRLAVADSQKGFVAPNAVSLAQALFAPEAWYRAIYAGEELAGFVMLEDESLREPPPAQPKVGVWRLMVDERFQGRGIGRAALLQVIGHARGKGLFSTLELSYVPGPGCPEPFYRGLGFRPTGRVDGREVVLEFPLDKEPS